MRLAHNLTGPSAGTKRPAVMLLTKNVVWGALLLLCFAACVEPSTEHRVRANAFLRGGDAQSALKECELGLTQKKRDTSLLLLKGKALFELARYVDARVAYDSALEGEGRREDNALADAYVGLAMIASREGDFEVARKNFEVLARINPKDASSQLNVARACLSLGDLGCATSHAEEAGRLRGNDEAVLYTLGTVYLASNKLKDAELTFGHICEVIPNAASCPYGKALVAAKSGDKERALRDLAEAVRRKLPNRESIATERAFEGLRDDPESKRAVGASP